MKNQKYSLIKDIWKYLWERKKWWLIPLIVLIILIGILIVMITTTPVPVFIYPLA